MYGILKSASRLSGVLVRELSHLQHLLSLAATTSNGVFKMYVNPGTKGQHAHLARHIEFRIFYSILLLNG